jgi:hypothetical protein
MLSEKKLVFSFCNSISSNCFQHMSLVVHTRQELAFGKDVFKMSSLYLDRVDAVLEGEEDEEEELEQHFERQIEQERGRQVRNFKPLLSRNACATCGFF